MPLKSLTVKRKLHCWGTLIRLDYGVVFMEEYCTVWNSSEKLKPLRILNIFPTNPKFTPGRFEDQRDFLEGKKELEKIG